MQKLKKYKKTAWEKRNVFRWRLKVLTESTRRSGDDRLLKEGLDSGFSLSFRMTQKDSAVLKMHVRCSINERTAVSFLLFKGQAAAVQCSLCVNIA